MVMGSVDLRLHCVWFRSRTEDSHLHESTARDTGHTRPSLSRLAHKRDQSQSPYFVFTFWKKRNANSLSYSRPGRFEDISELQTIESLEPEKSPRPLQRIFIWVFNWSMPILIVTKEAFTELEIISISVSLFWVSLSFHNFESNCHKFEVYKIMICVHGSDHHSSDKCVFPCDENWGLARLWLLDIQHGSSSNRGLDVPLIISGSVSWPCPSPIFSHFLPLWQIPIFSEFGFVLWEPLSDEGLRTLVHVSKSKSSSL